MTTGYQVLEQIYDEALSVTPEREARETEIFRRLDIDRYCLAFAVSRIYESTTSADPRVCLIDAIAFVAREVVRADKGEPPACRAEAVADVFDDAIEQAAAGKGLERHAAVGEAFEDQQIIEIGRRLGSNHFQLGQAVKKIYESVRLPWERGRAELLGALNYLAAAIKLLEEVSS